MRARQTIRAACGLLVAAGLLGQGAAGEGPTHWVVGSFSKPANARAEAARLERELGVAVKVTSAAPHRLLIDHGALDPTLAESRIREAGVADPWRLSGSKPSAALPADANTMAGAPVWLQVAEVTDIQHSIDIELALSRLFTGVTSESLLDDDRLVHRVFLGPVRREDLERVESRLASAGYDDVRRIPPREVSRSAFVERLQDGSGRAANERTSAGTNAELEPATQDDFNFATLRARKAKEAEKPR